MQVFGLAVLLRLFHAGRRDIPAMRGEPYDDRGVEFIPLSFWYDAPLIARDRDRRHDPWLVDGSPSYSPAQWSSWMSRACRSTSFSNWSRPLRPRSKPGWRHGGWRGH